MTKETIIAVHQIIREDLFAQLESARNIDTKISILAGFNALFLILCWQIYPNIESILFSTGLVLLFISLGLLFKTYMIRNWVLSPSPWALVKELNEGKEIEDIYMQTIGDIGGIPDTRNENLKGAIRLNNKRLCYKSRLFNISIHVLYLGLMLVGFSRIFS